MGCYISRLIAIKQIKICWFLLTLSIILLGTGFFNYQHTYPNIDIQGWVSCDHLRRTQHVACLRLRFIGKIAHITASIFAKKLAMPLIRFISVTF